MQHYQLGQQIGEFTITSYNEGLYTLTCKCGNTSEGDSTHITRKISNLMAEGFTACMQCSNKRRIELKLLQSQEAHIYTFKDVYREYVKKSKEREIDFEISLEDASKLFIQNCHYCNRAPLNCRKRDSGIIVYYQGIDRIDNTKGYTLENIVPCCKYCNSFKNDRSAEEFNLHLDDILKVKAHRLGQVAVGSSDPKWENSVITE